MLWQLFTTFFRIGLFSIGGGYAMLTMIQQEVVIKHHWLTRHQMTDLIAVSQITPGPIAINVATFVGYRQAGLAGAALTTAGVVLPSLMLMFALTLFYFKLKGRGWFEAIFKGLRPVVVGLIVAAAWLTAGTSLTNLFGIIVFVICFTVSLKYRINPFYLMLASGMAGILFG